jgi:hypothetical protein
MAGRLGRKMIFTVGGVALFMMWTNVSSSDGASAYASTIPATVFDGGGGSLEVEFTTNQPAELGFAFERYDERADEARELGGSESFEPGTHRRAIDVSPSTYLYLELGVPDAEPGAEISWSVSIDGRVVMRASDRLEEPLGPGYAFFIQAEADDITQMRAWR